MKNRMKRLSFLLVLALLLCVFPAHAAEIVDSGKCGENLTWTLDSDGLLTISGKGEMSNFDWSNSPFDESESIKKIIINAGVTSIGDYAFNYCRSLTSVSIPNSVTSIGSRAFYGCYELDEIVFPKSVSYVGLCAFKNGNMTVTFMNPDCSIDIDDPSGLSGGISGDWEPNVFIGFANSTAEKYAKSHSGINFKLYCPHKHTSVIAAVEKTCTEDGYTSGKKCDDCGNVLIEPELIPATGHYDQDKDHICDICQMTLVKPPIVKETKSYTVKDRKTVYEADLVMNCEGYGSCVNYSMTASEKNRIVKLYHKSIQQLMDDWEFTDEKEMIQSLGLPTSSLIASDGSIIMYPVNTLNRYFVHDGIVSLNNTLEATDFGKEAESHNGYFSRDGIKLTNEHYSIAYPFSEGTAFVRGDEFEARIVDTEGKTVLSLPDCFNYMDGAGDTSGPEGTVSRTIYGYCGYQSEGLIGFWCQPVFKKSIFEVNPDKKYQGSYHFQLGGYMDIKGNVVIPQQYYDCLPFSDGVAAVQEAEIIENETSYDINYSIKPGKWGFVDKKGEVVIPFQFDNATSFQDGFAVVEKDKKYGVIDMAGNIIIPFDYEEIYSGENGTFVYRNGNKIDLRTLNGEVLWETTTEVCSDYSNYSDGVLYYISDGKVHIVTVETKAVAGDVSGDGEVTAEDARLALRAAVGLEIYEKGSAEFLAADASKDGEITSEDARLILRAAVGLETLT